MNNFYVYVYLDPRKHGRHVYGEYCFLYEPFYVGKGSNRQYKKINGRNPYFINKFNKIKKCEFDPIVIKVKENLCEDNSFILEKKLIKLIGRKDLGCGSLLNFTDGGEGSSGWICSNETKKLMSENTKGENNPNYGKHWSEKFKRKQSEKAKGKYKGENNPMFGIHRYGKISPHFGKNHSEETKKQISITKKEKFKNGELISLKGEDSPSSKLTEKKVKIIYQISNSPIIKKLKISQKEIAKVFEISQQTISLIKNKKIWSHIKVGEK